jgi:predicted nucleic acid-binding protein
MSSSCVIDTHAWVEYLLGSPTGGEARPYIEGGEGLTPSVVLVELKRWFLKEIESGRRQDKEMRAHLAYVEAATQVVALDSEVAQKAGEMDFIMKKRLKDWPLADSIVYATARSRGAKVVSGDPHFEGLDDVIFIANRPTREAAR